jgi:hypothetical protein
VGAASAATSPHFAPVRASGCGSAGVGKTISVVLADAATRVPTHLTGPSPALTVAMITPPSVTEAADRRNLVPKNRDRIRVSTCSSKMTVMTATVGAVWYCGSSRASAASRYRSVELVPRRKRSIGPGEARWLLHVVRVRETTKERKHQ